MVTCWICNKPYEPNPEKVKAWAESGSNFDGADWECPECLSTEFEDDDDYDYEPEWRDCPHCGGTDEDPDGLLPWCPYCDHGEVLR